MRRVALLFALAAVLTGCSETQTGTPSAGGETPTATSGSSTKSPSSSSKAPVNRPKKVDLKTLTTTCTLLADAQAQQLGLKATGELRPLSEYPGAKGCSWDSLDRQFNASVYGIVTQGVDEYEKGVANGKATKTQVAGFPAYLSKVDTGLRSCFLAVDVADGQRLEINSGPANNEADKLQAACDRAAPVGEAMMATLTSGS